MTRAKCQSYLAISALCASVLSWGIGANALPSSFVSNQEISVLKALASLEEPVLGVAKPAKKRTDISDLSFELAGLTGTGALLVNFESYAKNSEIKKMIRIMKARAGSSKGQCYRHAKVGLKVSGLVDKYLKGESAKTAGRELEKWCFQNILGLVRTPEEAPVGSILVYEGGRHGHLEVRTEDGFVSDYTSRNPRTGKGYSGRNRILTGVYVKLNMQAKDCRDSEVHLASK